MKKQKYFLITLLVLILDQLSKFYIRSTMYPGENLKITPKYLWITFVENTGAAFSVTFGSVELNRILFSIIAAIAVVILGILVVKSISKVEAVSLSLVMGGAAGNLIDRIWLGRVTDFINCDFPDFIMERWPVFNVADSSIVIGVSMLVIYYLFFEKKSTRPAVRD
ncbi:MAG: signal peptidase II [Candidatus Cloacimonetes bacterium]|nr:signal peptidase II [Candidatus Cloacimonadota bacterium]